MCYTLDDEAEDPLYFELPVHECDLEDPDFGIHENNETFAEKEV